MSARAATPADWPEVAALRTRVFVEEQGVPPEVEADAADATAVHVLARDDAGRVVATGRLLRGDGPGSGPGDGTVLIGRMAADAAVRGRGHGAAVLGELHWQAVLRGARAVELHAQLTARGFYDRAGYAVVGEPYEEAGIAHVTMRRALPVLRPVTGGTRAAAGLLGDGVAADAVWLLAGADGGPALGAVATAGGRLTGLGAPAAGAPWAARLAAAALDGSLARLPLPWPGGPGTGETRPVRPSV